jgi:hypothetical protein
MDFNHFCVPYNDEDPIKTKTVFVNGDHKDITAAAADINDDEREKMRRLMSAAATGCSG